MKVGPSRGILMLNRSTTPSASPTHLPASSRSAIDLAPFHRIRFRNWQQATSPVDDTTKSFRSLRPTDC
ncbi:hypothetical protein VTI28DRAFT_7287 [Corynascus sepedonium]